MNTVFPILAIVEGQSSYEQVPIEDHSEAKDATKAGLSPIEESDAPQSRPVTSSVRAMHRLLCSLGRWTSVFRGIGFLILWAFSETVVAFVISLVPIIPEVVSDLFASLLVVQLHTVWVHYIISATESKSFWHRLPSFKTVFRATAIPTLMLHAALEISIAAPVVLFHLLKIATEEPLAGLVEVPKLDNDAKKLWTVPVFLGVHVASLALLYIPAQVVLTRIQASMLPADERTIVAVDRAFGIEGSVDKGYLSMTEALKSCKGSWGRLYKLYVKISLINFAVETLIVLFTGLQFLAMSMIFNIG